MFSAHHVSRVNQQYMLLNILKRTPSSRCTCCRLFSIAIRVGIDFDVSSTASNLAIVLVDFDGSLATSVAVSLADKFRKHFSTYKLVCSSNGQHAISRPYLHC